MKKIIIFSLILSLILGSHINADDKENSDYPTVNKKNQVGGRLGVWINGGDTPDDVIYYNLPDSADKIVSDINEAGFYLEGFFSYNIFPSSFIEISLGLANRGSVSIFENLGTDTTIDLGNLMIYPMMVQFKYYPMSQMKSKFQPYFGAGGGVYYGRRDIQLSNNYYTYVYGNLGESETDFNYILSGGFDWLLSSSIALDFNFKYMPINFSNPLVSIKDYKATAITVGVKYMRDN